MRIPLICLSLLLPTFGLAETFDLRDGDTRFSRDALETRLSGQSVIFFDDGESKYYEDGRYSYTYANDGGTAYGFWTIIDDGAVCIEFVNGFSRCDLYILSGDRMILLDEKGDRYPTRPLP